MDKISRALAALSAAKQSGNKPLLNQLSSWLSQIGIDVDAHLKQGSVVQAQIAPGLARPRTRRQPRSANTANVERWERLLIDGLSQQSTNAEQDYRLAILNTLLQCPQGNLAPVIPLFRHVHDRDPLFFGHLAAWYFDHGSVHDLKVLFIAFMASSGFSRDYRLAGLSMLRTLPPFLVERVVRLVKGSKSGGSYTPGIVASLPRSLRTAIERYLHLREYEEEAFDSACLHARKSLKFLYSSLRIKPSAYAQRVLFEREPPDSSRLHALCRLARSADPEQQARLIVENKLPYRPVISSIKELTPSVLVALVWVMTPQELINNMASLERRGAMQNADLRKMIEAKLEQAKTDKRVSALKTRVSMAAAPLDIEMRRKLEIVGDCQIRKKALIRCSTALLIDKSGSMSEAIEVGKQIASIIAPVCQSDLYVYAFDTLPYPIQSQGVQLSDWERALAGIKAGGSTACGAALEMMRHAGQKVEQIIVVTDQEENAAPRLAATVHQYAADPLVQLMPRIIIVNVGRYTSALETSLKEANVEVDTFTFAGDYRSLPNLIPMLSGGSRLDLLIEIMNYPMPA